MLSTEHLFKFVVSNTVVYVFTGVFTCKHGVCAHYAAIYSRAACVAVTGLRGDSVESGCTEG